MTLKNSTDFFNEVYGQFKDHFETNASPSFQNLIWQLVVNESSKESMVVLHPCTTAFGCWRLGLVEWGELGYAPTLVGFVPGTSYDQACDICDRINEALFGILPLASSNIVMRSMAGNLQIEKD